MINIQAILARRQERERRKDELTDRRSLAAKKRMRLMVKQVHQTVW